jgi:acyl-CoA synthetase (AMP-forming)/AMP-acid ligase II
MAIDFLMERFREHPAQEAIVWRDAAVTYGVLADEVAAWDARLEAGGVPRGAVVALEADHSPTGIALFLALAERAAVLVPLTASVEMRKPEFRRIAEVEAIVRVDGAERVHMERTGVAAVHPILAGLKAAGRPGLILFSSGSTGAPKAAVHDLVPLLDKFRTPRPSARTMVFLLYDHIGGINTMLHVLSNTGCLVTVQDRSAESICAAVERHRVEILPTSPTFLNLLLLSEAHRRHDLSCLRLVTYGTEPMPESTLRRMREALPHVTLQQTYGLSEVGIMRSKSRSSDSLWVRLGGEGFETRVVDGLLEIRAASAMLGYLNAPSPFTADGWFRTGDAVEVDGEYFLIRGRKSELINVGGEKVYPAEVESVLQEMPGVEDVTVTGEPNAITGQLVRARVKLASPEPLPEFRKRLVQFCRGRLPAFKIPQKVVLVEESMHGERFKRMRKE